MKSEYIFKVIALSSFEMQDTILTSLEMQDPATAYEVNRFVLENITPDRAEAEKGRLSNIHADRVTRIRVDRDSFAIDRYFLDQQAMALESRDPDGPNYFQECSNARSAERVARARFQDFARTADARIAEEDRYYRAATVTINNALINWIKIHYPHRYSQPQPQTQSQLQPVQPEPKMRLPRRPQRLSSLQIPCYVPPPNARKSGRSNMPPLHQVATNATSALDRDRDRIRNARAQGRLRNILREHEIIAPERRTITLPQ